MALSLAATGEWDKAISTATRAGSLTEGGDPEQSQRVADWVKSLEERAQKASQPKSAGR